VDGVVVLVMCDAPRIHPGKRNFPVGVLVSKTEIYCLMSWPLDAVDWEMR
jgi:hypothetical protein